MVAWQITASGDTWAYNPDPSHASEFEVNFREQPDGQTRVELDTVPSSRWPAACRQD